MQQAPFAVTLLAAAVAAAPVAFYVAGSKGGTSKPRAPVEAPDSAASIAYANILDLVSEGEIEGLVDGEASIFLDETPLSTNGIRNFNGVTLETRNGTQTQDYIRGFPAVESETGVGVALTAAQPWTRTFSNTQLSGCRVRIAVDKLMQQDLSSGDINGYRVEYRIDLRVGNGAYATVLNGAIDDKISSTYERSHRVDFPASSAGWTVRIVRVTPDNTASNISDKMSVVSFTELIDAKFRYPNSALIGLKFDASQFQSIPTRAFHLRGIKIKVPTNYNPVTRIYSGVWDGTFKTVYSNNPAWVYYDLMTNERYGLGHMVKEYQVDRYELYRIAQYCDFMVADGKGGLEPRFTCNLYLQKRADALKVLQDLSASFRGMTYWAGGGIYTSADMPDDPTYTYTNANVVDGKFKYSGFRGSEKYSVVLVSWIDMSDFGRAKVEYVEDRNALAKYGHRQTEVTALGCTSQGQAQRLGRWLLLTNQVEAETVTFRVALDGVLVRPGKVVKVANNNRAGRRIGGRVRTATTTTITLDSTVKAFTGDKLTLIGPDGVAVTRTITAIGVPVTWDRTTITWDSGVITFDTESNPSEVQQVIVSPAFPWTPASQSVWALDSTSLATERFRILSIKEDFSDKKMEFEVTATKHNASKFDAIDNGTMIEKPPVTVIPPGNQVPVASVSLVSDWAMHQGSVLTTMTISWPAAENAVAYEVQWKMNNGTWIRAGRTSTTEMPVQGIIAGRYIARVQAFNANGVGSVWTSSVEVALQSKTTPPPALSFLRCVALVFGIKVEWGYPAGLDIENVRRVEVWQGTTSNFGLASKQGEYSYPTNNTSLLGMTAGASLYFWARLVDSLGNPGPWTGPIQGTTSTSATEILEYLKGQITQTQLAQSLLSYLATASDLQAVDSRVDQVVVTANNDREATASAITTVTAKADGAQQSAADAYTLAGGKGKVFFQTTEPPASERLTQNLWIDTTGGENTPKGWNGSAWVVRTDKAATDAAAAAAAAQNTANVAQATAQTAQTATANLNGEVSAMYTIKTQITSNGRTYIAGIGVGTSNAGGIIESQVLVAASRFAVLDPNGTALVLPFVIQGGQVFIDQALIGTAWITNAKIADAAITAAKIADANITNAKIQDLAVSTGKIQDLAVSTLKIAGRAVTIPVSAYTEAEMTIIGVVNAANWTTVQGITVSSGGESAMLNVTCQVSLSSFAGYWRIRRSDGAILASGRLAGDSFNFDVPTNSLAISIYIAAPGTYALYLDIAPGFTTTTTRNLVVGNRAMTYLGVIR